MVARVNMSPLMVSQLIDALRINWDNYARKRLDVLKAHLGLARDLAPHSGFRLPDVVRELLQVDLSGGQL